MSVRYRADSAGTREFMNSKGVSDAMRSVADDMASQLNRDGHGDYQAQSRTVQGGWRATDRAGAEVVETSRDYRDVRRRLMVNLSKQYRMRGGG